MFQYAWARLLHCGAGRMQFEVIRRPIEYGDKVFNVGEMWPLVDVNADKGTARIAQLFYDQRRLAPNPAWLYANVPGAEKWMTAEELERAKKALTPEPEPTPEPIAAATSKKPVSPPIKGK